MGTFISNGGFMVWLRPVGRLLLRCLVGKYGTILLTGTLAILVGAGAYLSLVYDTTGSGRTAQGTVYSVVAVNANPARDPGSWLGRIIQVRGEVMPCMATLRAGDGLCAELTSGSEPSYGLSTVGLSQSLAASTDTLPVASASQVLHWGVIATYRVQLVSNPDRICGEGTCAEARLLDPAP